MMKKIILLLIGFFLIGCSFNKIYKNRESDKQEAQKVTEKFYSLINDRDLNKQEILNLFGNKFFQVTNNSQFTSILDKVTHDYGKIEHTDLSNWQTLVVEGTNAKSEYLLSYNVRREKMNTFERFTLLKENGIIKIAGYSVDVDKRQKNRVIQMIV